MLQLNVKIIDNNKARRLQKITIPQGWQEVPPQNAVALCAASMLPQTPANLNGIAALLLPPNIFGSLAFSQVAKLHPYFKWVFTQPLTYPCLEYFQIADTVFYLPRQNFYDVCMDEWADGMASFMLYEKTENIDYLHACIATFCRPLRKDYLPDDPATADEPREAYSGALALKRAPLMEQLNPHLKLYITNYIMQCVRHILTHPDYAILFPKPTPEQQAKQAPPKLNPTLWYDFSIEAAGVPGLGGDYEKVLKKKVHDVFRAMALYRKSQPN